MEARSLYRSPSPSSSSSSSSTSPCHPLLDSVPSIDFNNIQTIILNLLSSNKENRATATEIFDRLKRNDRDWITLKLIDMAEHSPNLLVRWKSSMLARQLDPGDRGVPEPGELSMISCQLKNTMLKTEEETWRSTKSSSVPYTPRCKSSSSCEELVELEVLSNPEENENPSFDFHKDFEDFLEDEDWLDDDTEIKWYHGEYHQDNYTDGIIDVPRAIITHIELHGHPGHWSIKFFDCEICNIPFLHQEELDNHDNEKHGDYYFCKWRYAKNPCHLKFHDQESLDMHELFHAFV